MVLMERAETVVGCSSDPLVFLFLWLLAAHFFKVVESVSILAALPARNQIFVQISFTITDVSVIYETLKIEPLTPLSYCTTVKFYAVRILRFVKRKKDTVVPGTGMYLNLT